MNQNCCFPEQVRCQIIARFRLHIVTVFRAQISGGARWGGGGGGTGGHWNQKVEKLAHIESKEKFQQCSC